MILAKPDEIVVGMRVSGSHMSSAHEGDTVRAVGTIIIGRDVLHMYGM